MYAGLAEGPSLNMFIRHDDGEDKCQNMPTLVNSPTERIGPVCLLEFPIVIRQLDCAVSV